MLENRIESASGCFRLMHAKMVSYISKMA